MLDIYFDFQHLHPFLSLGSLLFLGLTITDGPLGLLSIAYYKSLFLNFYPISENNSVMPTLSLALTSEKDA